MKMEVHGTNPTDKWEASPLPKTLEEHFRFEAGYAPLIEPEEISYPIFTTTDSKGLSLGGEKLPENVETYDLYVIDPFVNADPENYKIVKEYGDNIDSELARKGIDPSVGRDEAIFGKKDYNPLTEEWLANPDLEAVRAWRSLVPNAKALDYLMYPQVGQKVDGEEGAVTMSRESAMILRFGEDAIAIRARAAAMSKIAEDCFSDRASEYAGKEVKWLSLASGTAEPAIIAAKNLEKSLGINTKLVLADLDESAMAYVKANAEKHHFGDNFTNVLANILSNNLKEHLAARCGEDEQSYDLVEAMGFLEYVYEEGDEVSTFNGSRKRSASNFIKQSFELVKPGGTFLAGNMVYPRPQANYVFNVVDWPLINARSEENIIKLFQTSGVLDNPDNMMEIFRVKNAQTHNHVYDIVKVTKSAS